MIIYCDLHLTDGGSSDVPRPGWETNSLRTDEEKNMDEPNQGAVTRGPDGLVIDERQKRELVDMQRGPRSKWVLGVVFLVLLTEQSAMGFQLVAPALPQFAIHYDTTHVIWAITIFTLVGAVAAPVVGKLADHFGKKKVLTYVAMISTVGCLISALAPSFEILLVGRVLTAVSIAFSPVAYALIRDVFPPTMRVMSISIITNGVGVVTIVGPFLAGLLLDNLGMSSIFWFVAIITLVGGLGVVAFVPETQVRDETKFDTPGIVGLTAGMLLLLFTISQMQTWGVGNPRTLLLLAVSLGILVVWWKWEARQDEPFISPRLLTSRPTATVLLGYGFMVGAGTMISSQFPTLLQSPRDAALAYGFGASATEVAIFLIPAGVGITIAGVVVGALGRRYGFRRFLALAGLLYAVGVIGLLFTLTDAWGQAVFYGVVGLGGIAYAAGPNLMMQLSPTAQRGLSAAMLGLIGGTFGSILAQIGGLVLNMNISGTTEQGLPIYEMVGLNWLFAIAAIAALVGTGIALMIPKQTAQISFETDHTEDDQPGTLENVGR